MPLFPLAPTLALLALAYILYANWMDLSVGRPSMIANVFILIGAGLYYVWLRSRPGRGVSMIGPAAEPDSD